MKHFRQSFAAQRGPEAAAALAKDLGMSQYRRRPTVQWAVKVREAFTVETLEGTMKGKRGDYLVIGTKGEQYPVAKEIFESIYEPVKDEDQIPGKDNGCMKGEVARDYERRRTNPHD